MNRRDRTPAATAVPQRGLLFRTIALLTRFQLGSLRHSATHPKLMAVGYAVLAGAIALATITAAALLTDLPLLFPPLAPSAFILFYTPMAVAASPRSVVMAHTVAVLSGLFALQAGHLIDPAAGLLAPSALGWPRVLVIALAMGLTTALMAALECDHPPAAATALIAAMGYLQEPAQAAGLLGAVLVLILEAMFLNRILGGLPYPGWRADPRVLRAYGTLAGLPGGRGAHWQDMLTWIRRRD
jgi:CBS domain-containing membrane protein